MNFLAHHVIALRQWPTLTAPYVVGVALPDLLPLAGARLRPALVASRPGDSLEDAAFRRGVLMHLVTDAAFHKAASFAEAQAEVSAILARAPFEGIRVRRFFVAHVLVELALDAALLRDTPSLADDFYGLFAAADYSQVARWAEGAVGRPLPDLPAVLTRFAESRYLEHYREDEGVAAGLSRLCARARQDTFKGANYARLVGAVGEAVAAVEHRAWPMLEETRAAVLAGAALVPVPIPLPATSCDPPRNELRPSPQRVATLPSQGREGERGLSRSYREPDRDRRAFQTEVPWPLFTQPPLRGEGRNSLRGGGIYS